MILGVRLELNANVFHSRVGIFNSSLTPNFLIDGLDVFVEVGAEEHAEDAEEIDFQEEA